MAQLRLQLLRSIGLCFALGGGLTGCNLELNPQPEPPGLSRTGGPNSQAGSTTGDLGSMSPTTGVTTGSVTMMDGVTDPAAAGGPSGVMVGAAGAAAVTGATASGGAIGVAQAGSAAGVPTEGSVGGAGLGGAGGTSGVGGAPELGGAGGMSEVGGGAGAGPTGALLPLSACQPYTNQDIGCLQPAVVIDSTIYASGEMVGGYFADPSCLEPLGSIDKTLEPTVMRGAILESELACLFEVGEEFVGELYTKPDAEGCAPVVEALALRELAKFYRVGGVFEGELCE